MRSSQKKKTVEIKNIFKQGTEDKYLNFNVNFLNEDKTKTRKIKITKSIFIKIMKMCGKLPMQYQNYIILYRESEEKEEIYGGEISVNHIKYDKIFLKEDVFNIRMIDQEEEIHIENNSMNKIMKLMDCTSEDMLIYIDLMIIDEKTEYYERRLKRAKTKMIDRNLTFILSFQLDNHAKKFRKGELNLFNDLFDNVEKEYERKKKQEMKLDEESNTLKKLNEERERLLKENEELLKMKKEKSELIDKDIKEKEKIEKELEEEKDKFKKEIELYLEKQQILKEINEKEYKERELKQKKLEEIKNNINKEEKNLKIKKRKITEEYENEILERQKRIKMKKEFLEKKSSNNELNLLKIEEIEKEKEENEKLQLELNEIRKLNPNSFLIEKSDLSLLTNFNNFPLPKKNKYPFEITPEAENENDDKRNKEANPEEILDNNKIPKKIKKPNVNKKKKNEDYLIFPENQNDEDYASDSFIPADSTLESAKNRKLKKKKSIYPEEFDKLKEEINKRRLSFSSDHIVLYPFLIEINDEIENKDFYVTGNIDSLGNWDSNRGLKLKKKVINGKKYFYANIPIKQNQFPFEYKFFYKNENDNDNNKIEWYGKPYENYKTSNEIFNYLNEDKSKILGILNVNIRYLNNTDGNNIWYNRKERMIEIIFKSKADIIFFQEMTRKQYDDISNSIDCIFNCIGIYRDKSESSEKISIAYNKNKFTLFDWGQFWLSSTPNIPGSNDFNNFFPRICTWCFLQKIDFNYNYLFFNVHLDHVNMNAHLPSVRVLLNEVKKIIFKYNNNVIIFLGGCFYCDENDVIIQLIKDAGFNLINNDNTYHEFTGIAFKRWDYMFYIDSQNKVSLNNVKIFSEESVINKNKGIYVSDHFPLYSEFQIA